jgi:glycosyltransferase involved in cell wall biosynthesis
VVPALDDHAVTDVDVSLVLPAFNCATHIEANVAEVVHTLERLERPFEVLVVCDGSTDGTAAAAARSGDPRVIVLRLDENHGKGFAVTHGLLQARGRLIGWLDADLDIAPAAIVSAVRRFEAAPAEIDGVLGSKRHPGSAVAYPAVRRVYSAGFQALVRILFRVSTRDTQVGAKLFRREMVETVAPLLLIKRYAFDLEFLAVGAQFGFERLEEIPVELSYRFHGTSINWRAVRKMLIDTLAIAYRIHVRHWYVRRFAAQHRERLDIGTERSAA